MFRRTQTIFLDWRIGDVLLMFLNFYSISTVLEEHQHHVPHRLIVTVCSLKDQKSRPTSSISAYHKLY